MVAQERGRTPRVALAGYGVAGRGFHAPLLREAGLQVVAVSTSNPERQAQAREEVPGADVVPDLDALLEVDCDLVVLATPSGGHRDQALQVIEAGRTLVVDKPLATSASDALEVVDAAHRAGVPLTVFQNRRFDAPFATLARIVRDRVVGDVQRLEYRWERWRPEPKDRWRENASAEEGGGLLLDLHSHLVDGAVLLFGEVESVVANVDARTTAAEDDTFLVCWHTSGVVSHLSASSVAAAPGPRYRLLGSGGAYLLDTFPGEESVWPDLADADPEQSGWVYRGGDREPVAREPSEPADFYRAVAAAWASDDPLAGMPVDPRDAVHTLAVIDAARVSANSRQVVPVVTPGQPVDD